MADPPAAMELEVLPSAARAAADAERAALRETFERRRAARALAVPAAEDAVRVALRRFAAPVCLFGEDLHDRRERLRALMADAERAAALPPETSGGLDASSAHGKPVAEVVGADRVAASMPAATAETVEKAEKASLSPPPAPEPEQEEYYVEGTAELKALRLAIAMPSLERARRRLQAERELRSAELGVHAARTAFQRAEAATLKHAHDADVLASQVGDSRPLSCVSMGPRRGGRPLVATGSWGGLVKLWDADADATLVQTLSKHSARVSSVSLPQENPGVLLTSSADATAHMFVARDGAEVPFSHAVSFEGHAQRVSDCRMHPFRHSMVVTASFDGSFILHDDGRALLNQRTGHEQVYRTAIHPDGSLLATCGTEGGIRLWDLRSGRAVMTMAKAHVGSVTCIDFSGDGRYLASGGGDNVVKIWDLRGKRCRYTIPAHVGLVSSVKFAGGGGDLLMSASFDRSVKLWTTRRKWTLLKALGSHEDKVTALDCSLDAQTIVSACYDKTWKLWGTDDIAGDGDKPGTNGDMVVE